MAEYKKTASEFEALGVGVLAISVDEPARSASLRASLSLPFAILCDTAREVVSAWGLYNRQEKGGIARAAVFVIDRDMTVTFASIDATISRVQTEDVLAFVRGNATGIAQRKRFGGDWIRAGLNVARFGIRSPKK